MSIPNDFVVIVDDAEKARVVEYGHNFVKMYDTHIVKRKKTTVVDHYTVVSKIKQPGKSLSRHERVTISAENVDVTGITIEALHVGVTILQDYLQPKVISSKKDSSIVAGIQQHGTSCSFISHQGKVELSSRGIIETVETQCKFKPPG